jgi:DNA-binding protein YbaB
MQEELGHVEVEGISGGGITVRMTAKMEVKAGRPTLADEGDEREILEDLLVTAHNDPRKVETAMGEDAGPTGD